MFTLVTKLMDLWGARIRISKKMTKNKVLVLADPEFLGVISVRIDLDQMEAPQPQFLHYGWVFFEYIGKLIRKLCPLKSKGFKRTSNHGQTPSGDETVAPILQKVARALETDKRHPENKDEDTVQSTCINEDVGELIAQITNVGSAEINLV